MITFAYIEPCVMICSAIHVCYVEMLDLLSVLSSLLHRSVYVSYGGLLMRIQGDENTLSGFIPDTNVYLLMKKLAF